MLQLLAKESDFLHQVFQIDLRIIVGVILRGRAPLSASHPGFFPFFASAILPFSQPFCNSDSSAAIACS